MNLCTWFWEKSEDGGIFCFCLVERQRNNGKMRHVELARGSQVVCCCSSTVFDFTHLKIEVPGSRAFEVLPGLYPSH